MRCGARSLVGVLLSVGLLGLTAPRLVVTAEAGSLGELVPVEEPGWLAWLEHSRNVQLGYKDGRLVDRTNGSGPEPAVGDGRAASLDAPDSTRVVAEPLRGKPSGSPVMPRVGSMAAPVVPSPGVVELPSVERTTLDVSDRSGWVEVVEERSRFETVHRTPSGLRVVDMSSFPVHFQSVDGRWLPIDNSVRRLADGSIINGANDFAVVFRPMTAKGGVHFTTPDGVLRFVADGAAPVEPVVEADRQSVRYSEVFPGVDLVYRMNGGGVEELLIIKTPQAQSIVSFTVEGLELEVDGNGMRGRGRGKLAERVRLSGPETFDAHGRAVDVAQQIFETRTVDGKSRVTLGLRDAYVDSLSPDRFPLTVDPSVTFNASWLTAYANRTDNGAYYSQSADGYARIGNPYLSASSPVRWRTVVKFDYEGEIWKSVLQASLTTNVVSGSGAGTRAMNVYWANQYGFHFGMEPRYPTQTSPPTYAYETSGGWWYPRLQSTLGGAGTWQTHSSQPLADLYNMWTRTNTSGGALLLSGEESSAYTLKKFGVTLTLVTNSWPSWPAATTVASVNGQTIDIAASSASDPDGNAVL